MNDLIQQLIKQNYLKTPRIIQAFQKINRQDFLLSNQQGNAEKNYPLPIGFGQTISQPATVAFMIELLQPQIGDNVLDIGSGSGWATSLLAEIVGSAGKVWAIELISELKEFGETNTEKYNFITNKRATFVCKNGVDGLEKNAPFNCIHIAAATVKIPQALLEQLAIGGRLVVPIGGVGAQDLVLVTKIDKDKYQRKHFPGFTFVPLIDK